MHPRSTLAAITAALLFVAPALYAGVTYNFNNTLAADEAGAPALVSIDPLTNNGFETATVFGQSRTVFKWDGSRTPVDQQAGLTLDTTGVIADPTSFSLEMVFEFTEDTGSWRRIFDTTGRLADTGFYVEPGDRLQVYNDVTGTTNFTTNEFHHIALTVGNNTVKAYFDGQLELNSPTDKLNIVSPIVSFFVDNNLGGPAQTEFADGRVALIKLTDGVLTDDQIGNDAEDPLGNGGGNGGGGGGTGIPLPAGAHLAIPLSAFAALVARRWSRVPG
jgi:hypothetical protein